MNPSSPFSPDQPSATTIFRSVRWALRSTLDTAPRSSAFLIGSSLVGALATPAIALGLGSFIGSLRQLPEPSRDALERPLTLLVLTLALVLVQSAADALRQSSQSRLGDEVELALSLEILEHASRLDLAFYEDPDGQDLVALASRNPGRYCLLFITAIFTTMASMVETGALLGILFFIEPLFTPLLLLSALPILFYRWRIAKDRFQIERLKTRKKRWSNYYFSRFTTQTMTSSSKILDLSNLLRKRFEAVWRDIMETMRGIYRYQAATRILGTSIFILGLTIAIAWVGSRALEGTLTLAQAATYGLAGFRLRVSMDNLWGALASGLESSLFISNLNEFLKARPAREIVRQEADADETEPWPDQTGSEIVLDDLSFCYPGRIRPAIDGVSARLRPGETVVLVGRNGSGKTTLVNLIAKLYEPTTGGILIDGKDLAELPEHAYHDRLAVIFQHGVRFETSARENIAFGRWRHLLDDPQAVRRAISDAGLKDLIDALPDGEETHLGRIFGTIGLSAGQWKRIEIARALARRPAILIMDEPTAALDGQSEHEIFEALRAMRPKPTLIIVSHQLSLARQADRVWVLDQGRLVEQGTHDELLAGENTYAEMFRLQRQRWFG